MNRTYQKLALLALGLIAGCVDHRPIRNGLLNESIYLTKASLTAPNPKRNDASDDGWLFKVTAVKTSSPNVLADYVWPGYESDLKYVRMRFAEDKLQLIDKRQLQGDDPQDPNDDIVDTVGRVMMEFSGQHVDVKLRESLDGERTNYLEENTELPWQARQKFKVDFETTSMEPASSFAWYYGDLVADCATPLSTTLVPDSFEWDEADQYMSFVLDVGYKVNINSQYGACYSMTSMLTNVGTANIQYRFSFYRPGETGYTPEVVPEKDPVNKKYGSFQQLAFLRDADSGLLSAKALLNRWNPNRTDPVVYYFADGFPPELKGQWTRIEEDTNRILAEAGAAMRVSFREHDWDGKTRHFGDARYSFIIWHQDIDNTMRGLLGYGPSSTDPRTGETLSANVNLYNYGFDIFRFFIEDFLEKFAGMQKPDPTLAWEEQDCTAGQKVTLTDGERLNSTLFQEMRRVMELPEPSDTNSARKIFNPPSTRPQADFLADYHRVLPELRYGEPLYNMYVWRTSRRLPTDYLREAMSIEREYQAAMDDIMLNGNPFEGVTLYTREGIERQQEFVENMRLWRRNHDELQSARRFALGMENVYTLDLSDAYNAYAAAARTCTDNGKWESDAQYLARLKQDMVFQTSIHEFGHTLSLRHNFYGSVDAKHMRDTEQSASVMDYVSPEVQVGDYRGWGGYDEAALKWIYGNRASRDAVMADDFLFCTDEQSDRSPLCSLHDLGVTPAQITLHAIEEYDWLYDIRNRRAYRTFWDTSTYYYSVANAIFPLQRMWFLALFDWGGGGVQDTLKRLDQVDPSRTVLTEQQYNELAVDFYNDIRAANALIMGFYDAVINQSATFRNYQTEYDPYYGDILRVGIVLDKLYTMLAFLDLTDVWNYNPNVQTYLSMYDLPFGEKNDALSKRVLDNMLGASYDIFPWFKYFGLEIFAYVTNSNLIYNTQLRERIAIRRFERAADFEAVYGAGSLAQIERPDNPARIFVHDGEEYVYSYISDRGWHLSANRSRNPVSYQAMRDFNDRMNSTGEESLDNYDLKVMLAYYEYYNNFSGY